MNDKLEKAKEIKAKEIVDSAADLSQKETTVLRLLRKQKLPLSSIEIAYRLKLLPSEVDDMLRPLKQKGLVENPGENLPEVAEPIAQDRGAAFFNISREGIVALSVSEL